MNETKIAVERRVWVIDIPSTDDSDWHFEYHATMKKEEGNSRALVEWGCTTMGYKGEFTIMCRELNWSVILRVWQTLQSMAYAHAMEWNQEDAPVDRGVLVIPEKKLSTIGL